MTTSDSLLIEGLLQTIGSLDSLVRDLRGKVSFLRDKLTRLRGKDAEHDLKRKRLMGMIEAKYQDIKNKSEAPAPH